MCAGTPGPKSAPRASSRAPGGHRAAPREPPEPPGPPRDPPGPLMGLQNDPFCPPRPYFLHFLLAIRPGPAECAKRLNPPPPWGARRAESLRKILQKSQICKALLRSALLRSAKCKNLKNLRMISNPPSPRRPRAFRRAPPKVEGPPPSAKTKYCSVRVHVCQMSARENYGFWFFPV